jgi:hypothetical protein
MSNLSLSFDALSVDQAAALINAAKQLGIGGLAIGGGSVSAVPPTHHAPPPGAGAPPMSPPPGAPPMAAPPPTTAYAAPPASAPPASAPPAAAPPASGGDLDAQLGEAMNAFVKVHKLAGVKGLLAQLNIANITQANPEQKAWLLQSFRAGIGQ